MVESPSTPPRGEDECRAALRHHGISPEAIEELGGPSSRTVRNILDGKHRPRRSTLFALSHAIDSALRRRTMHEEAKRCD